MSNEFLIIQHRLRAMIYLLLYATHDNSNAIICAYGLSSFQESELENVRTQMQVYSPSIVSLKFFPIHSFPTLRLVYV